MLTSLKLASLQENFAGVKSRPLGRKFSVTLEQIKKLDCVRSVKAVLLEAGFLK